MSKEEKKEEKKMVEKKTWQEFRESGMLWFANRILHMFGWAIVFEFDKNELTEVYPARVKFRGFDHKVEESGFIKVTRFMKENIEKLLEETLA